jgi:hypothetical protein
MTDILTPAWIAISLAALAAAIYVAWQIAQFSRYRLMRCPRSGAVALVGVLEVSSRDGETAQVVHHCSLWPEGDGCGQGCLARYHETGGGFRTDHHVLRPFRRD